MSVSPLDTASRKASKFRLDVIVALCITSVIAVSLWTGAKNARDTADQITCVGRRGGNLALAIGYYMNDHGAFPPAYVTDATGKPVHSWRALILPYLDPELAKEYDYNEPWDGPNNSKLHNRMPSVFRCPNDTDAPEGTTNYVAVVGNETMWPFSTSRKRDDITDGLSNTILIVETKGLNVPWLEPSDLNFATMEFKINSPSGNGIGSYHPGIACAWTAGGGRHFFRDATTPETIRALLTVAGGEKVPVTEANLPE